MDLRDYIEKHGIPACSEKWGVSARRVKSYRYGERQPKPRLAKVMVEMSGGELSLAEIYSEEQHACAA